MARERQIRTRFFGDQAQRLLREDTGWTADLLAEELYAMPRIPILTDKPITIIWGGDQPAIEIVRTNDADPTSPPVVIRNPDGSTTPFPPPGVGPGGGGGGGGDDGDPPDPNVPLGGGSITPQPPPGPTPARIFQGNLKVIIHQSPPDPSNWDGQTPAFTATECRPYNPPLINAPTTALALPKILDKLNNFIRVNHLDGNYTVLVDEVTGPGPPCQL